ncbi:MAG: bifunctional 2-polyprenyl-6-hydroxyphenol methylase/3-demethylubiquinol 3-O-methyltransferase UbiG, partial [Pseudomonadota bacterium]
MNSAPPESNLDTVVSSPIEGASVDPQERAKFDRFASTWWDDSGPMWPLHRLNRFRIGFISAVIHRHYAKQADTAQSLAGIKVLDIGCGGGILSESMARLGCTVHGVDISDRNIAVARQHAVQSNLAIDYEAGTAESLSEQGHSYDVVLNMEVVEHVADLRAFMSACNAMVAPGGIQFVSTINRNPLAWFIAIFGAETVLGWLPKGTHEYRKLVKPAELIPLLSANGFSVTDRTGVAVNPFNRRMSARRSEAVNYMLA